MNDLKNEEVMQITDDYYVTTDKYNWILLKKHIVTEKEAEKRKNVVAGDVEYRHVSYHSSLENTLRCLIEKYNKKKSKEYKHIKDYISALEAIHEKVEKQLGGKICIKLEEACLKQIAVQHTV